MQRLIAIHIFFYFYSTVNAVVPQNDSQSLFMTTTKFLTTVTTLSPVNKDIVGQPDVLNWSYKGINSLF